MAGPSRPQLLAASDTFALLAAPTRLHLAWLLAGQDYDVGTLAETTGVNLATVSQHLAKLRLAGLVTVTRAGRRHRYSIRDTHVVTLLEVIFAHIGPDGGLAPDPQPATPPSVTVHVA